MVNEHYLEYCGTKLPCPKCKKYNYKIIKMIKDKNYRDSRINIYSGAICKCNECGKRFKFKGMDEIKLYEIVNRNDFEKEK